MGEVPRTDRDTLHFSVRVLDREVVKREHAVKGLAVELYLSMSDYLSVS